MHFFLDPLVVPFASVLMVLFALAVVEFVLFVSVGAGVSNAMNLLDFDSFPDWPFVNWFFLRGLPFMLVLVAALLGFGASGLLVQFLAYKASDAALPLWAVVPPSVIAGLLTVRLMAMFFKRIKLVSTTAVSRATFIGRTVTVTSNRASLTAPGEALLIDEHGARHYLMLRPTDSTLLLFEGDQAVISAQLEDGFFDARRA